MSSKMFPFIASTGGKRSRWSPLYRLLASLCF